MLWDLRVRAFVEMRRSVKTLMRLGAVLPDDVRVPMQWHLEVVESQQRGMLHGHLIYQYGGPEWSVADVNRIVRARHATESEDAEWCKIAGVPAGSYAAAVRKHCIHKCSPYCLRHDQCAALAFRSRSIHRPTRTRTGAGCTSAGQATADSTRTTR